MQHQAAGPQYLVLLATVTATLFCHAVPVRSAELTQSAVLRALDRGKQFLASEQAASGGWVGPVGAEYPVGVTSLCVMALINSGMKANEPAVRKGLDFLRARTKGRESSRTYEVSLLIMALCASKESRVKDSALIATLAKRLEDSQCLSGEFRGGWTYESSGQAGSTADPSNAQFAVLALREAAEAGYKVDRETWERVRDYWTRRQAPDGGFNYSGNSTSGSMTVAGIATLSIVAQMLRDDEGVALDGTPPCCQPAVPDIAVERALRWMGNRFSVGQNPGESSWLLYYLYGMERAGRLSGQRYFGPHDWYREGAERLVSTQLEEGNWRGVGLIEDQPVVATSFCLLFLSKGLAPVLINKLKHGDEPAANAKVAPKWNQHPRDVRNLADLTSSLPRWPQLLTAQDVDLEKAAATGSADPLLAGSIVYLTSAGPLNFSPAEVAVLKQFIERGGFLLAAPTCSPEMFEPSFRDLVEKITPPGDGKLERLGPDHLVFRSEYPLSPEDVPLYGVDSGCRTSIIYSPEDLGCLWDYWSRYEPPKRNPNLTTRIIRATRIGVNIIAYATGREPPDKLQSQEDAQREGDERIDRGLLQIAKMKHSGGWDAAPRALKNLLVALNETVGVTANTRVAQFPFSDKNIFRHPLIYMHGRFGFQLNEAERNQLKLYLDRGGLLFADACCGAKPFDTSFRELMSQLYPDKPFERIPIEHDLFSEKTGRSLTKLRRRSSEAGPNGSQGMVVKEVEPFLEGIVIDGRLAVIYSRYDISCALERQSSLSCEGYLPEDAVKLATNIVLYAALQSPTLPAQP